MSENKVSRLDNSVTVVYDRTKTNPSALTAKLGANWDIAWVDKPMTRKP